MTTSPERRLPMNEFRSGMLVRCVAAPEYCSSRYAGREGTLYSASEALHGKGATWIWNMRINGADSRAGSMAEVPIRPGEGFEFVEVVVTAPRTTTVVRTNAVLLAARAKSRAEARLAAAPSSTVIRELTEDILNLSEFVEILAGALGEAEFRR